MADWAWATASRRETYRRYFFESDQPLESFPATVGLQEKCVRLVDMPGYVVASSLPS